MWVSDLSHNRAGLEHLRRLGHLSVDDLLQGVDALAIRAEGVLFLGVSGHPWPSLHVEKCVERPRSSETYHKMHPAAINVSRCSDKGSAAVCELIQRLTWRLNGVLWCKKCFSRELTSGGFFLAPKGSGHTLSHPPRLKRTAAKIEFLHFVRLDLFSLSLSVSMMHRINR